MTEPYTIEFNGDCLGALVAPGAHLVAIPGTPISPGDLVSVLLETFDGSWARFVNALSTEGFAGLVKIFLGAYEVNGETIFMFGQLNPPTLAMIPESAIGSIDRIDFQAECTGADLEALSLLSPFAGIGIHSHKEAA